MGRTVVVQARMSPELVRKAREKSNALGISLSEWFRGLIVSAVEGRGLVLVSDPADALGRACDKEYEAVREIVEAANLSTEATSKRL